MTPEELDRYAYSCRMWAAYLLHINYRGKDKRSRFCAALLPFVRRVRPHITGVARWPGVWPEVEYLFRDRDNFVQAVEAALQAIQEVEEHQ